MNTHILFIFFVISLGLCLILFYLFIKERNNNQEIYKINKVIEEKNNELKNEHLVLDKTIIQKKEELDRIQQSIFQAQETSQQSFQNYCLLLDEQYNKKEQEYQKALELLNNSYDEMQDRILADIDQIREELDKIASTRAAAIQAQLREEEIKNKEQFYSIFIEPIEEREVHILQSIENEFRDPRPIRMIIWSTYYLKKANDLCSRVLIKDTITGIYKITSKTTNMSYIGQAKNIKERWREHLKCGLGIDTPVGNKLYQAMKKEGINNFTFELLEECSSQELDEKEVFYINLYDSKNYGFNLTSGNKKC